MLAHLKIVFMSFCLFVLLFFRLAITVIECLKGLKSQKSRIVSKFECGSQSISDLKGRFRAAGAAKNLGERFGTHPAIWGHMSGVSQSVDHRTTHPCHWSEYTYLSEFWSWISERYWNDRNIFKWILVLKEWGYCNLAGFCLTRRSPCMLSVGYGSIPYCTCMLSVWYGTIPYHALGGVWFHTIPYHTMHALGGDSLHPLLSTSAHAMASKSNEQSHNVSCI